MYEDGPPEGRWYLRLNSFEEDLRAFLGYSSLTVAPALMPSLALLLARKERKKRTTLMIGVIASIAVILPTVFAIRLFTEKVFHVPFWASVFLVAGCVYAVYQSIVTLKDKTGEQGACHNAGKPAS
ncbi:hypothetical protein VDG1235_3461 [Verrucomicrobiia bacterium DG1235]|nr:hypothetical protein VDG1235_3461 [Verrucomicrobiae bacterium DG1235]